MSANPGAPVRASAFAELGVPPFLIGAIEAMGITEPFPVQVAALPSALEGRDILGRARTGSGKTLAFAVPVVARLAASTNRVQPKQPRALVLVPTRELAAQVASAFLPLARAARLRELFDSARARSRMACSPCARLSANKRPFSDLRTAPLGLHRVVAVSNRRLPFIVTRLFP